MRATLTDDVVPAVGSGDTSAQLLTLDLGPGAGWSERTPGSSSPAGGG